MLGSHYKGHCIQLIMAGRNEAIFSCTSYTCFTLELQSFLLAFSGGGWQEANSPKSPHFKQMLFLLIIGCFLEFTVFLLLLGKALTDSSWGSFVPWKQHRVSLLHEVYLYFIGSLLPVSLQRQM